MDSRIGPRVSPLELKEYSTRSGFSLKSFRMIMPSRSSAPAVAGALLYVIGVIGVTMMFNVPLNNELAALQSIAGDGGAVWARYLSNWTFWNTIRGVAAAAACVAFAMALTRT
jgi:uncharacterized membrane protein